ncbi:MAG: hypothetical protein KME54_00215 [Tolypothrix brevis GSE-NOS-MK-07-07A]|nr:hypothetical protein [Tolypothrix brevis GSE-NOS-MK-07-07A]
MVIRNPTPVASRFGETLREQVGKADGRCYNGAAAFGGNLPPKTCLGKIRNALPPQRTGSATRDFAHLRGLEDQDVCVSPPNRGQCQCSSQLY